MEGRGGPLSAAGRDGACRSQTQTPRAIEDALRKEEPLRTLRSGRESKGFHFVIAAFRPLLSRLKAWLVEWIGGIHGAIFLGT